MRKIVGSDSMVWITGIFAVQTMNMMISSMFVVANPLGEEGAMISIPKNSSDQLRGFWS